jgi:uncharacterized protein (DUF58 family)
MKELFLNRRFFMFLWGGVFALLLTFVFPRVYPWVIWALGCGGGLVVVDITLLYGFGKACGAQRIVGDKFSNGEENPVRIRVENKYPFAVRVRVVDEAPAALNSPKPSRTAVPPRRTQPIEKQNASEAFKSSDFLFRCRIILSHRSPSSRSLARR